MPKPESKAVPVPKPVPEPVPVPDLKPSLEIRTMEKDENQKDEDENEDEDRLGGEERGESGRKRADSVKSRDIIALRAALAGFRLHLLSV